MQSIVFYRIAYSLDGSLLFWSIVTYLRYDNGKRDEGIHGLVGHFANGVAVAVRGDDVAQYV